ncbi:hypothetical protein AGMMS49940_03280 [Spirochaetia bacterium]|nr:hypothetical protein AGMMS49940_03280 [Spirochaetia bacterium]
MVKPWKIVLLNMLLLCVCAGSANVPRLSSAPSSPPAPLAFNFLATTPAHNELVFLGVSGRRLWRKDAVRAALEDAARKVALYHGVEGHFTQQGSRGLGFFDSEAVVEKELIFDEGLYKNIGKDLQYNPDTDVYEYDDTIFVRTRYAGNGFTINYPRSPPQEKPVWISSPPWSFEGFVAGVGYANRHKYLKDAIIKSYEAAVYAIIRNTSNTIGGSVDTYKDSANTLGSVDVNTAYTVSSSAILKGFYVLEIWIDPATKAVWTLAVAISQ